MVVLSLFDGMSCGQIALKRAIVKKDSLGPFSYKYYASEIDKYAIKVTQANYPDTIQLGSIENWKEWDIEKPDIIIGGSPCQGFSFAGAGLNFDDPRSKLFFTYSDIVKHYKPEYFLLENVKMAEEHKDIISQYMDIAPVQINSALVSAQNRERLYWTNINAVKGLFGEDLPGIEQPEDKKIYLKDILENNIPSDKIPNFKYKSQSNSYFKEHEKMQTLSAGTHGYSNGYVQCRRITGRPVGNHNSRIPGQDTEQILELREDEKTNCLSTVQKDNVVIRRKSKTIRTTGRSSVDRHEWDSVDDLHYRKLTPIECERLQTVPDNYTNHVSNTQRYKMLGNGWTVDVIAHIFKEMFQTK